MPQFRKDPIADRWVIVNIENPKPASEFKVTHAPKSTKVCPFCPGNESMTPQEIISFPKKNSSKNSSHWQLRVIPNKFPALQIEETPTKSAIGMYDKMGGFGAHEVIIENPEHDREMSDLTHDDFVTVLRAYRDRCLDLRKDARFKYILIFKNFGSAAGASLEHPHSQLIGLPIVPSRVIGEMKGAEKHFGYTDRCVFCDMINQEKSDELLTVSENEDFLAICPFVSRFPFEMWITPKQHVENFDALTDAGLDKLATVFQAALQSLKQALGDPPFNFMIHTSPIDGKETSHYHWHIEIIPHLTQIAGFELATGFYVNPTTPESCAKTLRSQSAIIKNIS